MDFEIVLTKNKFHKIRPNTSCLLYGKSLRYANHERSILQTVKFKKLKYRYNLVEDDLDQNSSSKHFFLIAKDKEAFVKIQNDFSLTKITSLSPLLEIDSETGVSKNLIINILRAIRMVLSEQPVKMHNFEESFVEEILNLKPYFEEYYEGIFADISNFTSKHPSSMPNNEFLGESQFNLKSGMLKYPVSKELLDETKELSWITTKVASTTLSIFEEFWYLDNYRRVDADTLITSCLVLASQMNAFPLFPKMDLKPILNRIKLSRIMKYYRRLLGDLDGSRLIPKVSKMDYYNRMCHILEIDVFTKYTANLLLKKIDPSFSSSPIELVGSVIYIAAKLNNRNISQENIREIMGVSISHLREKCQQIEEGISKDRENLTFKSKLEAHAKFQVFCNLGMRLMQSNSHKSSAEVFKHIENTIPKLNWPLITKIRNKYRSDFLENEPILRYFDKGYLYHFLGNVYTIETDYQRALKFNKKALNERLHQLDTLDSLFSVAQMQYYLKEYQKSISFFDKCILKCKESKTTGILPQIYLTLGYIYLAMKRFDEVYDYANRAKDVSLDNEDIRNYIESEILLGKVEQISNKIKSACSHFKNALKYAEEINERDYISYSVFKLTWLSENIHDLYDNIQTLKNKGKDEYFIILRLLLPFNSSFNNIESNDSDLLNLYEFEHIDELRYELEINRGIEKFLPYEMRIYLFYGYLGIIIKLLTKKYQKYEDYIMHRFMKIKQISDKKSLNFNIDTNFKYVLDEILPIADKSEQVVDFYEMLKICFDVLTNSLSISKIQSDNSNSSTPSKNKTRLLHSDLFKEILENQNINSSKLNVLKQLEHLLVTELNGPELILDAIKIPI